MALSYVAVDRDQQFLLPPSMRDWLEPDHLAWFVLEVVDELDTAGLHESHRNDGVGRAAYDPDMLLALTLYSYCQGVSSSRAMSRLCEVDIAYRVIAGNHRPHHGTISRFIVANEAVVADLFVQVLGMCQTAGMVKLGAVAIDGTKVAAAASLGANRSREWLEREAARIVGEHRRTDEAEDAALGDRRGDELPDELADPKTRKARIRRALEQLREQQQGAAERDGTRNAQRAEAVAKGRPLNGNRPHSDQGVVEAQAAVAALEATRDAKLAAREARRQAGQKRLGREPLAEPVVLQRARAALERIKQDAARRQTARADATTTSRANVTDPDSRIMRDGHGATLQGYNAQAAVSQDQIVVAADVTNQQNDSHQLVPMVTATRANLAATGEPADPGMVLADAGYCSEDNLTAPRMPDLLVATTKRRDIADAADAKQHRGEAVAAMAECLSHPAAAADYAKRAGIVEPIFADAKDRRGIRRFRRRGLKAADAEWKLICLTHNLMKIFRHRANSRIVIA